MARQSRAPSHIARAAPRAGRGVGVALLTRPAEQGARFAESLHAALPDLVILHSPLIAPVFLQTALPPGRFDAVIVTSVTGVEAARRISADGGALPRLAWCVGDRTAEVARSAGFEAQSAAGDADALVALVAAQPAGQRLLHLHGQETRGDIARRLISAGTETHSVTVYAQTEQPLTAAARAVLAQDGPVLMPLFSPRTATLLVGQLAETPPRAPLLIAAMSAAVAAALPDAFAQAVVIAARPTAEGMLAACVALAGPTLSA